MKIVIHPLARTEFESKIRWLKKYGYQVNSPEIFYKEIPAALDDLSQKTSHREIMKAPGYFRIGPTPTHSYSLIYRIEGSEIHVLAIAAPQRRPSYWKGRKI